MYDTATRVSLVKKRVCQKQRRQESHVLLGLFILCLFLSVSLVGTLGMFTGSGHSAVLSVYGSILLHEDVGAYMLAGVIFFTAGVVITALCIRYRERNKQEHKREEMRR